MPDQCRGGVDEPVAGGDVAVEGGVVVATITYQASYAIDGPLLAGDYHLGTLDGTPNTHLVPVSERRAVRTSR
jgi:hypothetical protein